MTLLLRRAPQQPRRVYIQDAHLVTILSFDRFLCSNAANQAALVSHMKDLTEQLTSVAMCEKDNQEFLVLLLRGLCHVDKRSAGVPSWIPTWEFPSLVLELAIAVGRDRGARNRR